MGRGVRVAAAAWFLAGLAVGLADEVVNEGAHAIWNLTLRGWTIILRPIARRLDP